MGPVTPRVTAASSERGCVNVYVRGGSLGSSEGASLGHSRQHMQASTLQWAQPSQIASADQYACCSSLCPQTGQSVPPTGSGVGLALTDGP